MKLAFIGFTFDLLGKILVIISVLLVHSRVIREHKIYMQTIREMKKERYVAITGLLLIVIGYLL